MNLCDLISRRNAMRQADLHAEYLSFVCTLLAAGIPDASVPSFPAWIESRKNNTNPISKED